jgi:hypothetical protein
MEIIAEIIANIVLVGGLYLIDWCIRHKEATKAILAVALVIVDIFVLLYIFYQ